MTRARSLLPRSRRAVPPLLAAMVLVAAAAGVWIVSVSAQNTAVTVSIDGFTLSCPSSVSEGAENVCTLTNTARGEKGWPVVAMLHVSADPDRALVRGEPIDVQWGARNPSVELDQGVWWIGPELVAYSRFDWKGRASQTIPAKSPSKS